MTLERLAHVIGIVLFSTKLGHGHTVPSGSAPGELSTELPAKRVSFVLVPVPNEVLNSVDELSRCVEAVVLEVSLRQEYVTSGEAASRRDWSLAMQSD